MDIVSRTKLRDCYDEIALVVGDIKNHGFQHKYTRDLQMALNKFFDAKCIHVFFTQNTDKLPFGVFCMPKIPAEKVIEVITTSQRLVVTQYYLELDSKLFSETLNLTTDELTAVIMHDIAELVNDSGPAEEVSNSIDKYLKDNHKVLKISDSIHYMELLSYGFRDAMRKFTTLFEKKHDSEPDKTMCDFFSFCNYKENIESSFNKIDKAGFLVNKNLDNKYITLSWVLRLYEDVLHNRIPALMVIDRCTQLTSSQIEKRELTMIAKRLNRIDDDMLIESSSATEEDKRRFEVQDKLRETVVSGILGNNNYGKTFINAIQENMDDMDLVMSNADNYADPDEMQLLLHYMYNNMALIKDYIHSDENLSKGEVSQLNRMCREIEVKRNQLSKEHFYDTRKTLYNKYGDGDEV